LVPLCAGLILFAGGCRAPAPPAPRVVAVTRPGGTWEGTGDRTIGFVSDSGRFRILWEAHAEDRSKGATFRLAVHSAVSGRPIQVAADVHEEGRGTYDFDDDPRPYNFMVESANARWSFSVEEIVAARQ
jgi:hypothetical protein